MISMLREIYAWLALGLLPLGVLWLSLGPQRKYALSALWATMVGFALLPLVLGVGASLNEPGLLPSVLAALCSLVPLGLLALSLASPVLPAQSGPRTRTALAGLVALALLGLFNLVIVVLALSAPRPGLFGVMAPQFLPWWAFSYLALGGLVLSLARGRAASSSRLRLASQALALPALLAGLLALLPLLDTPLVIAAAEAEFQSAFGVKASSLRSSGMRSSRFSMGDFLLGAPVRKASSRLDQVYLRERASNGRDYEFRFDAWLPPLWASTNPGPATSAPYPVIIRIHGGAWVMGDKGPSNMGAMNRYLASEGYAVFDIQYGLSDTGRFSLKGAPEPTEGPFGLEDMVRQIGAFTSYLADHAADYPVDLGRVYVSGGSAGGQLALASVLATSSGWRKDHPGQGLDPRLRVRGIVPFYPAVGLARDIGVAGAVELDQPSHLLGPGAPPALVYQGRIDGMVPLAKVRAFREAWRASGAPAFGLIEFPFAGHGSDLVFAGPFNQVFLYCLESFLALEGGLSGK